LPFQLVLDQISERPFRGDETTRDDDESHEDYEDSKHHEGVGVFQELLHAASANSIAVSRALIFMFLLAPYHADWSRVSAERPRVWSVM